MSAALRNAVNALLVVASVALCLAAAELYLVWDNRRPQIPATRLQVGGGEFRVWESAERLSDFRNAAIILGDSFTAGEACADAQNYPSHLGKLAGRASEPYRVLNLGVPGADTLMYLQLVEGLVASGRVPSSAVVTLYSNDVELTCSACRFLDRMRADPAFTAQDIARLESFCRTCTKTQNSRTGHYGLARQLHTWLYNKLYVYGLLRDVAVGVSMKAGFNVGWGRSAYPALWQDASGLEFKVVRFSLAGIRDSLSGAGVSRMMVVLYPDVENLRADNAYVAIYRGVEQALSRELGVPVFSGYPAFLNDREARPNMPFSLVDHHPSCKAHEIFAKWVFGRFQQVRNDSALVPVRSR
jgi:hypothetical protein